MRTQKEIFNQIAIAIIGVLPPGEEFRYAVLEIKRLEKNIGFTGYYLSKDEKKNWLDIFRFNLPTDVVEDLYIITQTHPPIHKNWNRVKYTLFSEGKFEVEYILDAALQNEVDRLNSELPAE